MNESGVGKGKWLGTPTHTQNYTYFRHLIPFVNFWFLRVVKEEKPRLLVTENPYVVGILRGLFFFTYYI